MSKKDKVNVLEPNYYDRNIDEFYRSNIRQLVFVDHRSIDTHIETEQGAAHSVKELFEDYVLGKLDPSMISGSPSYDPEGSDDVDPFNSFGVTFEQASQIQDAGHDAYRQAKRDKTVANAQADRKQQVNDKVSENVKEDDKQSAKDD